MIRIESEQPGYRFVAAGDVAVIAWGQAPTVQAAQKLVPSMRSVHDGCGRAVSVFVILADGVGLPDELARAAMTEALAKTAPLTKQTICVIEGQGFRAAAIRSIAAAMQFFARRAAPIKVFSAVEHGIAWILKDDPRPPPGREDELWSAVHLARAGR